jgi:predicted DNA-binding transcriptional regulator AlpA
MTAEGEPPYAVCMQTINSLFFIDERQLSQQLGISLAALRKWRLFGRGPRFRKIGRAVRYSTADVSVWLQSRPGGGEEVIRGQ